MNDKLIDRNELAEYFGVSVATIDRWIRDGVPTIKPSPGIVRFDLSEVVAWAKSRTIDRAAV